PWPAPDQSCHSARAVPCTPANHIGWRVRWQQPALLFSPNADQTSCDGSNGLRPSPAIRDQYEQRSGHTNEWSLPVLPPLATARLSRPAENPGEYGSVCLEPPDTP